MVQKHIPPSKKDYTIYSISNCKYCKLIDSYIKSKKKIIDCDKYITSLRDRDAFYKYIHKYTIIPYIHFPMIFKDGKFIGGYKEYINLNKNR